MNSNNDQPLGLAERECGNPKAGKIYMNLQFVRFGVPFRHYICDPVLPMPAGITIKPRGMSIVDIGHRKYIMDHVGSGYYPNPSDYIEEVGRLGLHQLIERSFPFGQITPDMYVLFSHSSALIDDPKLLDAYNYRDGRYDDPLGERVHMKCPNSNDITYDLHMEHGDQVAAEAKMCAGLHWAALQTWNREDDENDTNSMVTRTMKTFEYRGRRMFDGTEFKPGIILALPVAALGFTVYENTMTNEHEDALEALKNLPAELRERVVLKSLAPGEE